MLTNFKLTIHVSFLLSTVLNPERSQQLGCGAALKNYGLDLTREAAQGKLDPVIGRENEVQRVVQILS